MTGRPFKGTTMTRTGSRTLVVDAPTLLNVAAAFVRETPSEVNENAQLTGRYQFFSDGRKADSCDVTITFHVSSSVKYERGVLTCYIGNGSTGNMMIKAAFIRALILKCESVRLNNEVLMLKDVHELRVEYKLNGVKCKYRVSDDTDNLAVLQFFLTKARASRRFESAKRFDERFHETRLRYLYLSNSIKTMKVGHEH